MIEFSSAKLLGTTVLTERSQCTAPRWGRFFCTGTPAQAIALAIDVDDRWEQSKTGNSKIRPSSEEIKEAYRALLAINPKSEEFPKTWAAFVRLRKIDRDVAQM